uniref:Uncharacterized protein n=1 Tax=Helicotheca tamesis TaxID=374047 RepID=A0A7S2IGP8_9STRA
MLSDQHKLAVLAAIFLFCLSTLFTSTSFQTGERGVGTLNPQFQRSCSKAHGEAKACLGDGHMVDTINEKAVASSDSSDNKSATKSCKKILSQVDKCETVVGRAYQHINMAGCIRQIQSRTVCEIEWCHNKDSCKKHCDGAKEDLKKCEKMHLERFFRRAGLDTDGTSPK